MRTSPVTRELHKWCQGINNLTDGWETDDGETVVLLLAPVWFSPYRYVFVSEGQTFVRVQSKFDKVFDKIDLTVLNRCESSVYQFSSAL